MDAYLKGGGDEEAEEAAQADQAEVDARELRGWGGVWWEQLGHWRACVRVAADGACCRTCTAPTPNGPRLLPAALQCWRPSRRARRSRRRRHAARAAQPAPRGLPLPPPASASCRRRAARRWCGGGGLLGRSRPCPRVRVEEKGWRLGKGRTQPLPEAPARGTLGVLLTTARRRPAGLRVVVVGAGMAGIRAASDLQHAGAEVVVLEARDRCAAVGARWDVLLAVRAPAM